MLSRVVLKSVLATAGVGIDGRYGWDLDVRDPSFVWKALTTGGTLALGQAYMDGRVRAEHIELVLERLAKSWLSHMPNLDDLWYSLKGLVTDHQSVERAQRVATEHYDMPARMYEAMLGPTMCYTSALGMTKGLSLDKAQINKVDRMVRELCVRDGHQVLDIGSGFGTTVIGLGREGALPIGLSNSEGHVEYARARSKKAGIEAQFVLGDWRAFRAKVAGLTSTEMAEALGRKHLPEYFRWGRSLLPQSGGEHRFSLQVITTNRRWSNGRDAFLEKYIFPGGETPRYGDLERAWAPHFKLADRLEFGQDYALTLREWRRNLARARDEVADIITERRYRMMEFYLALCETFFKLNITTVGQYTLVAR